MGKMQCVKRRSWVKINSSSSLQFTFVASTRLQPIVTGATVIGIKYNGGVLVAADTLAPGPLRPVVGERLTVAAVATAVACQRD